MTPVFSAIARPKADDCFRYLASKGYDMAELGTVFRDELW